MILVDDREKSQIPMKLTKIGVETRIERLDVGDYQIIGDSVTVAIESKSVGDYISSIVNGRLSNELAQMCENFDRSILAVHGNLLDALIHRKLKRSTYFNFLGGCIVRESSRTGGTISVLLFDDDWDFVAFLKTVDSLVSSDNVYRSPTAQKIKIPSGKEQLYTTMWMFPPSCHIGKKRAKLLLDHFGTIMGICQATTEELTTIDGIGKIIADGMINHINKDVRRTSSRVVGD